MKYVYCVMEIADYEYGCRVIESVWASYEQAEAHIEDLGQIQVTFWDDSVEDLYIVETYEVQGI